MGRILRDMAITMVVGPTWTGGAAPTLNGGVSIMGRIREIDVDDSLESTNVKAGGDYRKKNRYHTGGGMLKIANFVRGSGYFAKAPGAPSPIGKWVYVTTMPDSAMTVPDTWLGVITKWRASSSRDEAQIEEIEIDLDPDVDPVV